MAAKIEPSVKPTNQSPKFIILWEMDDFENAVQKY
jgi:hypothetical protein